MVRRYGHTLYSRLNDKLTGAIGLIMHRLHEKPALGLNPRDDLAGHVLAHELWEVVSISLKSVSNTVLKKGNNRMCL
jgi:hypothetical protein